MRVFILFLSYLSGTMCVSIIIQYNITTSSLLLSTSHNVYTCHSPKYHYIIVTVVYLVYCCITAVCVLLCEVGLVGDDDELVSLETKYCRNLR